jgi:hypothetical protein
MASRGYVQPIQILIEASSQTILDKEDDALKLIWCANTLPYFPKWNLLQVATQFNHKGEVKKGVPCLLLATTTIDYLTLIRYMVLVNDYFLL